MTLRGWLHEDGTFNTSHCTSDDVAAHGPAKALYDDDTHLFCTGEFRLHSGQRSSFKIDCDALADEDITSLAVLIAARFRFCRVHSVPNGGDRLATALNRYAIRQALDLPELLVDDVYTTGKSIREVRQRSTFYGREVIGVVVFARSSVQEDWIHPMFEMWSNYSRRTD